MCEVCLRKGDAFSALKVNINMTEAVFYSAVINSPAPVLS